MTRLVTMEKKAQLRRESVVREVELEGSKDIMFDRYAGMETKLQWYQKIYLIPETNDLCIPVKNISSLLSSHNTNSAPKRLRDSRKFKQIANACLSYVDIIGEADSPNNIRFYRNGEPIRVGAFSEKNTDEQSGIYYDFCVARLDKGIPNDKERPVLPLPWGLKFKMSIRQNNEISEQEILNLLSEGGIAIGLGTYRGLYGKFKISSWK